MQPNNENNNVERKGHIPTEYDEKETLRVLTKQNKVPSEGRVKIINDFPKTSAIGGS